jgi:hypothetical protein
VRGKPAVTVLVAAARACGKMILSGGMPVCRPRTTTYVKATLEEVAAALSALTGEPHPLADACAVADA